MNIEEELYDLSADLLTEQRFFPFIERLFAQNPGVWSRVELLCSGIPLIEDRVQSLSAQLEGNFMVSWLDYSGGPYVSGFASIMFFEDQLLWSSIAVYNRERIQALK